MMFENLGGIELPVVLFVAFVFFGSRKLPELGKNLSEVLRGFRQSMLAMQRDIEKATQID
jgi:TatA/E family protein of Tat protein translocase